MNSSAALAARPQTRAPAGSPPVRVNALLAVLALAGTVFAMMQALVIPALPRIQASLGAFAAGTLVCAAAGNLGELVAGRVIQGAAGGIYPLAFAIIRDRLPRERVAGAIGLVSSLLGIGGGPGLVLPAARTGSATAVNTVVRNAGGARGGQLAAAIIVSAGGARATSER